MSTFIERQYIIEEPPPYAALHRATLSRNPLQRLHSALRSVGDFLIGAFFLNQNAESDELQAELREYIERVSGARTR